MTQGRQPDFERIAVATKAARALGFDLVHVKATPGRRGSYLYLVGTEILLASYALNKIEAAIWRHQNPHRRLGALNGAIVARCYLRPHTLVELRAIFHAQRDQIRGRVGCLTQRGHLRNIGAKRGAAGGIYESVGSPTIRSSQKELKNDQHETSGSESGGHRRARENLWYPPAVS